MSYVYLFKLILIGDTGKSCLLLQFADSRFKTQHDITIGVEYGTKTVKVKDLDIKLQIWDTAGSETFKSITRTYYKGVAGAFIVFDMTRRESFKHALTWLDEVREHGSAQIVVTLVGNKSDIEDKYSLVCKNPDRRQVTTEEALRTAKENGMNYVETSAKTGKNVSELFMEMANLIYKKVEEGTIDVTNECYGVRSGSGVPIGARGDNKKSVSLTQGQAKKDDQCGC